MKKLLLYYFSGTGNTLQVANKIKQTFEKSGYLCDFISLESTQDVLNASLINLKKQKNYELIGLVFPVAVQSTFPLVWDFIDAMPQVHGQKIFMADTLSAFSGGVVGPMKKILTAKGYDCIGAMEFKMSNSLQSNPVSQQDMNQKNEAAIQAAEIYALDLMTGNTKWKRVPILSQWMRSISAGRKIWTKTSQQIKADSSLCTACGLCEKSCPLKAIDRAGKLVTINHELCISCMRCVNHCPANAFSVNGKKLLQQKNGKPLHFIK